VPVQNIKLTVDVENTSLPVVREPSQDVVCNFVDGQAFGSAVGIGLKSTSGWWTVESVEVAPESAGVSRNFIGVFRYLNDIPLVL